MAKKLGLYRQARWFNRHFLNRTELRTEKADLAFYKKIIRKHDLVFDVGANYGEKTRIFLSLGAKTVAFEPQSDCVEELRSRCGNNKKLIAIVAALSDKSGSKEFYIHDRRVLSSFIKDWDNIYSIIENVINVPVLTLNDAIAIYGKPNYIKIDVEGAEYEVLKGLNYRIPLISFEFHFEEERYRRAVDCIEYLSNLGPIKLNITPAENLVFEYKHWLEKNDFIKLFLNDIPKIGGFAYGDIWVKMLI